MASKITATQIFLGMVVAYGGWKVVSAAKRRRPLALPAPAQNPALAPSSRPHPAWAATRPQADWTERGTTENIVNAIEIALAEDGHQIESSNDLAWAAGARLWPGLSILPAGMARVREVVWAYVRWDDAPASIESHEACVRMRAKAVRTMNEMASVYDGSVDPSVLHEALASSVFPTMTWPPSPETPAWAVDVWRRCGDLVRAALAGAAPTELADAPDATETTEQPEAPRAKKGRGSKRAQSVPETTAEEPRPFKLAVAPEQVGTDSITDEVPAHAEPAAG